MEPCFAHGCKRKEREIELAEGGKFYECDFVNSLLEREIPQLNFSYESCFCNNYSKIKQSLIKDLS